MWIGVFRAIARRFPSLSTEDSYSLSLEALIRCYYKGKHLYWKYVWQACNRRHIGYLRVGVNRLNTVPLPDLDSHELAEDRRGAIDVRMDVEAAIQRMEPALADVAGLMRLGNGRQEIAGGLGLSRSTATRRIADARTQLHTMLAEAYGPHRQVA